MNRIVTIQDERYEVIGTVPTSSDYFPEDLKQQWNVDTVLRNDDILYLTRKLIDAEFEDLK